LTREEPYADMNELFRNDIVAGELGMKLIGFGAGSSRLSMTVTNKMLNAYGAGHGGIIYTLADVAFAVACNSHGVKAVGLSMNINYRRPVKEGDTLFAEAREESLGRTTALYRIRIEDGSGKLVAVADGLAYRQQG